jgi:hypothetical protein
MCALVRAKIFRLVAFQFQCSIIQAWENAQSAKNLASFLRKLGEAINQGWLHCATKQRTELKKEAITSHKNYTMTEGINSCCLQNPA